MNTASLSKAQRRRLRELTALAYQRELRRELSLLEEQFARWRRDEIDEHELTDRIHEFHQGPSRKLYSMFVTGDAEFSVAGAIVRGVITEDEAGPEALQFLAKQIRLFRDPGK